MIVIHTTSLNNGGTEGNAIALARAFTQIGLQSALLVDHPPYIGLEGLRSEGLTIRTLDVETTGSTSTYRAALRKALRSLAPSLVHSHIWERWLETFSECRALNIDTFITLHQTLRKTWFDRMGLTREPLKYWRFRRAFKTGNPAVINISDKSQSAFKAILPEVSRSRRIYLGVPFPDEVGIPQARGQQPKVVWVGSLINRKRPFLALRVWKRVVNKFPGSCLTMIGDGPLAAELREASRGIKGIDLVGSMHPWRPLGLEAQILFHTAGSEGIPTVALEAMSLGIPFVGTTAGATEEAILHNKTGLLAAVDDEDALYAILRRAIEEPEERLKLGSAGRNRGLNTFRFDSHVSNLLDAYRELCSATTGNTLATEISQVLSATVRLR